MVVDTVGAICHTEGAEVSRCCMFNNRKAADRVIGLDLSVCAAVPEILCVSVEGREFERLRYSMNVKCCVKEAELTC